MIDKIRTEVPGRNNGVMLRTRLEYSKDMILLYVA